MTKDAKKDDAIQTQGQTSMERPAFIKGGHRGTDHIKKEDLQIARLALAQGLTPMVAEGKKGINLAGEEVEFTTGVLFNSMSQVIYGKGPIDFFIVRGDRPRFIEFFPREAGGGVKDMNVPPNDPRTRFTTNPQDGKSTKPAATMFYDFIICMLPLNMQDPMKNIISLSFKSSGLKVARELNTLIKYRNADLFAGVYRLTSIVDPDRRKGIFNNFHIENAGWINDENLLKIAEGLYTSLADRHITVDRTGEEPAAPGGDDDDDEFNAEQLERESQAAAAAGGAPRM